LVNWKVSRVNPSSLSTLGLIGFNEGNNSSPECLRNLGDVCDGWSEMPALKRKASPSLFSSKVSDNSKHGYMSTGEFGLMVFLERGKGDLLSESKKIKDPTGSSFLP
jgi:hypothetical protein